MVYDVSFKSGVKWVLLMPDEDYNDTKYHFRNLSEDSFNKSWFWILLNRSYWGDHIFLLEDGYLLEKKNEAITFSEH